MNPTRIQIGWIFHAVFLAAFCGIQQSIGQNSPCDSTQLCTSSKSFSKRLQFSGIEDLKESLKNDADLKQFFREYLSQTEQDCGSQTTSPKTQTDYKEHTSAGDVETLATTSFAVTSEESATTDPLLPTNDRTFASTPAPFHTSSTTTKHTSLLESTTYSPSLITGEASTSLSTSAMKATTHAGAPTTTENDDFINVWETSSNIVMMSGSGEISFSCDESYMDIRQACYTGSCGEKTECPCRQKTNEVQDICPLHTHECTVDEDVEEDCNLTITYQCVRASSDAYLLLKDGWYQETTGFWYFHFISKQRYDEANNTCFQKGGRLASTGIRDRIIKEQLMCVVDLESYPTWIGLYGNRKEGWIWSDGFPYTFNEDDWIGTNPHNQNCIAVDEDDNDWKFRDKNCNNQQRNFICEIPCELYYDNNCYRVLLKTEKISREQSRGLCEDIGWEAAVLYDSNHFYEAVDYMRMKIESDAYIWLEITSENAKSLVGILSHPVLGNILGIVIHLDKSAASAHPVLDDDQDDNEYDGVLCQLHRQ